MDTTELDKIRQMLDNDDSEMINLAKVLWHSKSRNLAEITYISGGSTYVLPDNKFIDRLVADMWADRSLRRLEFTTDDNK